MTLSLVLSFVALLMIGLEFFLPGGILGAIGGVILVISAFFMAFSVPGSYFILYLAIVLLLLAFVVWFALRRIRSSGKSNTILLKKDMEGYVPVEANPLLIGKEGVTITPLSKSGFVMVDAQRIPVVSDDYISKDQKVKVLSFSMGLYKVIAIND